MPTETIAAPARVKGSELTVEQAQDLARHFLGPRWRAAASGSLHKPYMLTDGGSKMFVGAGWRSLFRAAGVSLPLRSQYIHNGSNVLLDERPIATAVSTNMAVQIANALNAYETRGG